MPDNLPPRLGSLGSLYALHEHVMLDLGAPEQALLVASAEGTLHGSSIEYELRIEAP